MRSYGTQYRSARAVSWSLPFEKFEVNQLPHLEKESLKFYKEQLKLADKDKALSFYFFEHRNLSVGVKAGIKTAYNQFKLKYSIFSIDNLKNYFTNLDITYSMTSSSLSLHWERMKRLAICSFSIKKQDFTKIKFSSNKQGREENVSATLVCKKKMHPCAKKMHPPFWGIQKVLNNKNNLLVKVKFTKNN